MGVETGGIADILKRRQHFLGSFVIPEFFAGSGFRDGDLSLETTVIGTRSSLSPYGRHNVSRVTV
jgi:hypothetical protein